LVCALNKKQAERAAILPVEPLVSCFHGRRDADVRPDFNWDRQPAASHDVLPLISQQKKLPR